MKTHFILLFLLIGTTSCYRMPEEGEVSMIPNVNNPNFTQTKSPGAVMPSVEY